MYLDESNSGVHVSCINMSLGCLHLVVLCRAKYKSQGGAEEGEVSRKIRRGWETGEMHVMLQ